MIVALLPCRKPVHTQRKHIRTAVKSTAQPQRATTEGCTGCTQVLLTEIFERFLCSSGHDDDHKNKCKQTPLWLLWFKWFVVFRSVGISQHWRWCFSTYQHCRHRMQWKSRLSHHFCESFIEITSHHNRSRGNAAEKERQRGDRQPSNTSGTQCAPGNCPNICKCYVGEHYNFATLCLCINILEWVYFVRNYKGFKRPVYLHFT